MSNWAKRIGWAVVWITVGGLLSYLIITPGVLSLKTADCLKKYSLTSQSLDCDTYDESASQLRVLDSALREARRLYVSEGKITRMGVWVRDLETKQWAAVNETDTFIPASQLKLPLMIAYLKVAGIEPTLLDAKLVYQGNPQLNDSSQDFAPAQPLTIGGSYTVEELIEDMIKNSDNNAAAVLLQHLEPTVFNNTLVDLGIRVPNGDTSVDFVTAKTYANIFRVLYNSSYLNREYSQKALDILSKSTFKGISYGLPPSLTVAHKYGEREIDKPDGSVDKRELHDCGIVYKAPRPYSICIMTEGKNWDDLLSVIRNVSAIVYKNM